MKTNYWYKLEENCCYHIYNQSIGNELLFKRDGNWDYFMTKYWQFIGDYASTYAYCLIPNHFHFLMKFKKITPFLKEKIEKENTTKGNQFLAGQVPLNDFLVDQFKRLFTSYTGAFNKENGRNGSLFQSKFKRIFIKNKAHFEYILFYIHHNPIHHNLVKEYSDWMRSSFNIILDEKETKIAREVVLKYFVNQKDITGIENFKLQHERFKENYVKRLNNDDFYRLNAE